MPIIEKIFEWISENIEWIFSGVGTELILLIPIPIIVYMIKKFHDKHQTSRRIEHVREITNEAIKNERVDIEHYGDNSKKIDSIERLAQKFYGIYEEHGVKRTQIPGFVNGKFDITLLDVKDENSIIYKLNDDLLDWTSEKFGIKRGWFEAGENDLVSSWMYNHLYLYGNTGELIELLSKLIDKYGIYTYKEFVGVRCLKVFEEFKADKTIEKSEVIVVIIEKVGDTSTSSIYKYSFTDGNLRWNYGKSRRDIKKMIRIIEKFGIYNVGYDITYGEYERIMSLEVVPRNILDSKKSVTWYPYDFDGTNNDRIDHLENEDNNRFREEFINIDKRISRILEDKKVTSF